MQRGFKWQWKRFWKQSQVGDDCQLKASRMIWEESLSEELSTLSWYTVVIIRDFSHLD